MTNNTDIWESLSTTDPKATRAFDRGGFKGTAIQPIWMVKRMTEQFGPCGTGWGVNEPQFQIEHCEADTLVYCTVSVWHGSQDNLLWGVGGDKVRQTFKKGQQGEYTKTDDEAFKKAFTDAVSNALKYLGVGADVHMGLFDDSKYVEKANSAEQKRRWEVIKEPIQNELLDVKTLDAARQLFSDYWRKMQAEGLHSDDWKSVLQSEFATKIKELENPESEAA